MVYADLSLSIYDKDPAQVDIDATAKSMVEKYQPFAFVDGIIAQIWGFPHSGPANEFTRYHWTDGRPSAGVLSIEALYHRWISAGANFSRGRANLISRAFLCHDFLHSDIVVDTTIDLSDPEVVSNAVVANSSCAGCHQTLDPPASHYLIAERPPLKRKDIR